MIYKKIGLYENNERPFVEAYILSNVADEGVGYGINEPKGAVVITPGGAYSMTSRREAEPIAMKFTAAGYHAFVVWYRTMPKKATDPLEDLARAVALIREHSEEWNVDTEDITVCGFSAGGHLAASLGVFWDRPFLSELLNIDKEKIRPNRQILCYPVISAGEFINRGSFDNLCGGDASKFEFFSLEKQVGKGTPSAFLWHTAADGAVPVENSLMFAASLSKYKIPFEMHIFPEGTHGLSTAEKISAVGLEEFINPVCSQWVDLAVKWLNRK